VIDPRKTNFVEQLRALIDRGLDAEVGPREFLRLQRAVAESRLRVPIAGYAEGLSVPSGGRQGGVADVPFARRCFLGRVTKWNPV
jgi:hypothetical protein